jgi:hypothetical protein
MTEQEKQEHVEHLIKAMRTTTTEVKISLVGQGATWDEATEIMTKVLGRVFG